MFKYILALILFIGVCWSMNSHSAVTTLGKQLPDGRWMIMKSDPAYGGAITDFTFDGKPFVYTGEHGSSLMSAMTFDGFGECFNPTQGGSRIDAAYFGGVVESSVTRSTYTFNDGIYVGTELGYWTPPNTPYPAGCGAHPETTVAINTTIKSDVMLNSNYRFGYDQYPNVMVNNVAFTMGSDYSYAGFEPSTIYTPGDLSDGYYVDLTTGALTVATPNLEQNSSIIITTPGLTYSVGVMSKQKTYRYTFFSHPTVPLWAKVGVYERILTPIRKNQVNKGEVIYVLGSTIDEVVTTMMAIKQLP
jgi:hypothetical protein